MNHKSLLTSISLLWSLIVASLLAGCTLPPVFAPPGAPVASAPEAPAKTEEVAPEVTDAVAGLVAALEDQIGGVRWGGTVTQPFFSVPGWLVRVDGQEIQAFEYTDEAARLADARLISADGTVVGTTAVEGTGQPTFWANGKLIVLYFGDRAEVKEALSKALGEQLTRAGAGTGPAIPSETETSAPAAEAAPATEEPSATLAPVAEVPPEELPVLDTNVTVVQAAKDLKIYSGPGGQYGEIGDLSAGNEAKVTGVSADGNWWRVICPDGGEGSCWISGDRELTKVTEAK